MKAIFKSLSSAVKLYQLLQIEIQITLTQGAVHHQIKSEDIISTDTHMTDVLLVYAVEKLQSEDQNTTDPLTDVFRSVLQPFIKTPMLLPER